MKYKMQTINFRGFLQEYTNFDKATNIGILHIFFPLSLFRDWFTRSVGVKNGCLYCKIEKIQLTRAVGDALSN